MPSTPCPSHAAPGRLRRAFALAAITLAFLLGTAAQAGIPHDPDPAWREAEDMGVLIEVLELWLDANAPWPRRDSPPKVRIVTAETAEALALPPRPAHGNTRGLYDAENLTIFLIKPWDRKDPQDVSVLLHELVHDRQSPHHLPCPGAQELPAYRLQDRWLRERGLEAPVNWIAVVLEAGCTPRDIHPE